jgi:hypothetical protein
LLKSIAQDAARAGGQAAKSLVTCVALMPDDTVCISLGVGVPESWTATVAPRALAVRCFRGDGKLLSERYSPVLAAAHVAEWLRG